MIESVATKNKPILTIGGQRFDFESFEFSQKSKLAPFPGAEKSDLLTVKVIARWMDDGKPSTILDVVVIGEESIVAILVMFPGKGAVQEIAVENAKGAFGETLGFRDPFALLDSFAMDDKRVRFLFESAGVVSMPILNG